MVMAVVMVALKLEQTIFVGCWSVELPGYTLQSIDEMLLSNRSNTSLSLALYPIPRSAGNRAVPSRATVGISMTICWEAVMEAEGRSTAITKLFSPGMVTVLWNSRVVQSDP